MGHGIAHPTLCLLYLWAQRQLSVSEIDSIQTAALPSCGDPPA